MLSTPLHHKPIFYGSPAYDWMFWILIAMHAALATVAPIAGLAALACKKGGTWHVRAGKLFAQSMWVIAGSGIVLDMIRLCFFVAENHQKYIGYSMPSTYPARFAFLYAGISVLYLLRETTPPRVYQRPYLLVKFLDEWLPTALIFVGVGLVTVVLLFFNPWTGALWMIATFMLVLAFADKLRAGISERSDAIAYHRYGMAVLISFCLWGAFQGFGPALALLAKGPDLSAAPYVGNQPGPFTPAFFIFLALWLPFLTMAVLIIRYFRRRPLKVC